jgi:hypothetical protein
MLPAGSRVPRSRISGTRTSKFMAAAHRISIPIAVEKLVEPGYCLYLSIEKRPFGLGKNVGERQLSRFNAVT